jgi:hypothetical protein
MDIPSYVASGPTGTGTWGWDTDGSYGDWYGAHELGHTYGRGHANYCGAGGGPAYPYASGRISPSLTGNTALYGFDISTRAIYPPTWKDLMTYCDWEWMSDFTYEGLMTYFKANLSSTAGLQVDRLNVDVTERLLVAGTLNATARSASLGTLWTLNAGDVDPATPGPYDIVLRGVGGAELARYPFTPLPMENGPALPGTEPPEEALFLIHELVPYVAGTTRVEITDAGGLLGSVSAGVGTPSVTVVSPNGGETLAGAEITVSWTASDPDGDPLRYNIQYSADNGATWELLAQDVTGNSVALDAVNVPRATQGRFRVGASDGIHAAYDTSDGPFTVPNRNPEAVISAPESGVTVAVSQTVAFVGTAYDIDEGTLPEERLTWRSSLDGPLGVGESLSVATLSVGAHTITFRAEDGEGGVGTATVTVNVVADPGSLPVADQLLASPALIAFDPAQGATTVALAIENANAGNPVAWAAVADQPWIHVETTSGVTPADILVSYADTGLGFGLHTGTVTITSPDLPGQSVVIQVRANLYHSALRLPMVTKG